MFSNARTYWSRFVRDQYVRALVEKTLAGFLTPAEVDHELDKIHQQLTGDATVERPDYEDDKEFCEE